MSSHEYKKPGRYVAVCNKTNFDGHYIRVFDFPSGPEVDPNQDHVVIGEHVVPKGWEAYKQDDGTPPFGLCISASWYFLNRVNFSACLEAVYPIGIFKEVQAEWRKAQQALIVAQISTLT
jgi:hypothetical protein